MRMSGGCDAGGWKARHAPQRRTVVGVWVRRARRFQPMTNGSAQAPREALRKDKVALLDLRGDIHRATAAGVSGKNSGVSGTTAQGAAAETRARCGADPLRRSELLVFQHSHRAASGRLAINRTGLSA